MKEITIRKIKKNEQEKLELQREYTQKGLSESEKRELKKKIDQKSEKGINVLQQINLNKCQIEKISQKLKQVTKTPPH